MGTLVQTEPDASGTARLGIIVCNCQLEEPYTVRWNDDDITTVRADAIDVYVSGVDNAAIARCTCVVHHMHTCLPSQVPLPALTRVVSVDGAPRAGRTIEFTNDEWGMGYHVNWAVGPRGWISAVNVRVNVRCVCIYIHEHVRIT